MKKFFVSSLAVVALVLSFIYVKTTDRYVRNRVLLLSSDSGVCTGVEVKAPSGKYFVLTAAHCRILLQDNAIRGTTENGKDIILDFVAEDPTSDLMLLKSDDVKTGISIASSLKLHEHVHSLTHGGGAATYRSDGETLDAAESIAPITQIKSYSDLFDCISKPKNQLFVADGAITCLLDVMSLRSTAIVIPGSSGGPLINQWGSLVGIASMTDGTIFGYYVQLKDIKAFMKGY